MTDLLLEWVGFTILVLILLIIDLVVFNKKPHEITIKESLIWSAVWISLALAFNVGVFFWFGETVALQFFTGYLIEKSLSVDNLFVFLLIFSYFKVDARYQHKVLFWGILGALIMRSAMILIGAALIERFSWILYIFGAFLVFTGIRMMVHKGEEEIHPEKNIVVRLFRRMLPVTPEYHWDLFFIRKDGRLHATLLFVVLIVVETTDLVFAVDSIPAIFAITTDPFIVYTSNVFAILGLRSLYFALAGIMDLFYYLKLGLSIVLTFIGLKMLVAGFFHVPIALALGVVALVLGASVLASIVRAKRAGSVAQDDAIKPPPSSDDVSS